jgi:putative membrane protein
MKSVAAIGALLGLALLTALFIHGSYTVVLQALALAGWGLLWLVPYRLLFYLLYAIGWLVLLRPYNPLRRGGFGYLLWVTIVREAVDRLLPVASVGGGVVAVRLLSLRGFARAPAAASVIVEILLTMIVMYLFAALGLALLIRLGGSGTESRALGLGLLLTLPAPVGSLLLLRYGAVFGRLQKLLGKLARSFSDDAAALDRELRACLRRWRSLLLAAAAEFAAFITSVFEIWFVLRLFGHPVSFSNALVLESMTQAVRHFAFFVPAGLGVQEAGLVLFGHLLGINTELALAVSLAKRMREVLCGLPALLSWQWLEGSRLRTLLRRGTDAPGEQR